MWQNCHGRMPRAHKRRFQAQEATQSEGWQPFASGRLRHLLKISPPFINSFV